MKLSVKLTLTMSLLILVVVTSTVFSIFQMKKVNDTATELAETWMLAIVEIAQLDTLFSDFRIAEIQFTIATNDDEKKDMNNF